MIGFQDIIVYLILAGVAAIIVRHIYRQVKCKDCGCSCRSCSQCCDGCHCHDTQK